MTLAVRAGDEPALFHVGIATQDIERTRDQLTEAVGLEWTPIVDSSLRIRTPAGPDRVNVRGTMSVGWAVHLELVQGEPGGIWWPGDDVPAKLHHLGIFVPDLAGEGDRLDGMGLCPEVWGDGPGGTLKLFSYHIGDLGFRLELVDGRSEHLMARIFDSLDPR